MTTRLNVLDARDICSRARGAVRASVAPEELTLHFLTQPFVQLRTLGTGTFGRVKLVQYLATVSSENPVFESNRGCEHAGACLKVS